MAGSEISVVTKTYDFLVWLLPHLAKYTRDHRFTLGDRTEVAALAVLEALLEATYAREKREALRRADTYLTRLRYLVRLAKDLRQISVKQYEFAARAIDGIGMEIGGWSKQQTGRGNAGSAGVSPAPEKIL